MHATGMKDFGRAIRVANFRPFLPVNCQNRLRLFFCPSDEGDLHAATIVCRFDREQRLLERFIIPSLGGLISTIIF